MIHRISEIYVAENVVFFYAVNMVKRYKGRKDTWKNQLEITISGQGSILKMLRILHPYLVNKQRMAELMMEAIEWVMAQPARGRMSRTGRNYTLEPAFHALMEKIAQERAFHIEPSTTIRKAREILSW